MTLSSRSRNWVIQDRNLEGCTLALSQYAWASPGIGNESDTNGIVRILSNIASHDAMPLVIISRIGRPYHDNERLACSAHANSR